MRSLITHWLLILALLAQSISQVVPAVYASNHAGVQIETTENSNAVHALAVEQAQAVENSHCHEANEAEHAQLPADVPICPCCDDDCSMPRCQSVALLVDLQLSHFLAQGSAELMAQTAVRWVMRTPAPPTPPPEALLT